jgi:uncharacterized membrane protein
MTKPSKLLRNVSLILGFLSMAFFGFNFLFFSRLRPKMVAFEAVGGLEESLMNWVGIGLLLFLAFCLLSLFQIAWYLKNAKKVSLFSLLLVLGVVLSLLGIFADVALLGDIGKQYKHNLSQPEWGILYPVMGFQFITALLFTYLHLSGSLMQKQLKHVARDSNVFLIVQYVGIVCGLLGLSLSSLGFVFSRAWSLLIHTSLSSVILLVPYVLVVICWFLVKLQEKKRQWYDEKQIQDIGKSAFLTLVISVFLMTGLFAANYNNLGGVVSVLWLPLYLFLALFLFSLGNLYFSGKD